MYVRITYGYYYDYSILRLLAAFPNRVINSHYTNNTYEYSLKKKKKNFFKNSFG